MQMMCSRNRVIAMSTRCPQQGFTLIELLVALMIFAMLAVSGWQIMNSITKSRDRANRQLNELAQVQYAYLQLSQDLAQVNNYVINSSTSPTAATGNDTNTLPSNLIPSFVLTPEQIRFVRFASADPRLNPPPVLARVVYIIKDGTLIKQRFYQLNNPDETPVTSILLTGIKDAKWIALTPDAVDNFPDAATLQQAMADHSKAAQGGQNAAPTGEGANAPNQMKLDMTPYQQLPKGVELSFTYQSQPLVWRFALPSQAPSFGQMGLNNPSANNSSTNDSANTSNSSTNTTNDSATNNTSNMQQTMANDNPEGDN